MTNQRQILVGVWLMGVLVSFATLSWYKTRPGFEARVAPHWIDNSLIARDTTAPYTLVLFAHPKCSCTEASLYELHRLLVETKGAVAAKVVFYFPTDQTETWAQTASWKDVVGSSGTQKISAWADQGGRTAFQFGARTSGEAMLYNSKGDLLFRGGLTAVRGHIGAGEGAKAIRRIAMEDHPHQGLIQSKTFGCSLFSMAELAALEGHLKRKARLN